MERFINPNCKVFTMVLGEPEVEVRAYDRGGFGDIAGAMRVASHLNRGGLPTFIKPTSQSAFQKLKILESDSPVRFISDGRIKVDVAGHYNDAKGVSIPHQYSEDMDHEANRRNIVPLYIKSGIVAKGTAKF